MHMLCIIPSDATVAKSTNKDWVPLGLRFLSVYYTDAAWNVVYWHIVFIVDSGYPSVQYIRICYPVLLVIQPYHI